MPLHARRYDLVAFDFDGTLADTFPWFADALDGLAERFHFRRPTSDERRAMRHLDAREILKLLGVPMWKMPAIAAYTRRLMTDSRDTLRVFEGVGKMLEQAQATGAQLAVVSSNSIENVRGVLGSTNASRISYFECGVDLFGKAAKLRRLLKRSGVTAPRAALVGDELRDIDAARAAGMHALSVNWGYNHPDALSTRKPEHLFTSVEELTAFWADRTIAG